MLQILTGILCDITERQTNHGTAVVVEIAKRKWENGHSMPGDSFAVWYCNDAAARAQRVLKKKQDYVNKTVILMANVEEKEGKTSYYGRLAPTTYGLLRVPVQLNPEATADDFMNADYGIEECQDAGILDKSFELNLEEPNSAVLAENIYAALSILQAVKKAGITGDDMVTTTIDALRRLVIEPSAAYIGMLLKHTIYDADAYPNVTLSVTVPNYTPGASSQWCNCKVFKPRTATNAPSNYSRLVDALNKKVLKDKDRVILYLSGEQARGEQLSFNCYAYQKA